MPDVLRIRYLGETAFVTLAGREVDNDSVFDVAGRVVTGEDAPPEDADHVLVEAGNPPQTWALAKALYAVETPPKRTRVPEDEPEAEVEADADTEIEE